MNIPEELVEKTAAEVARHEYRADPDFIPYCICEWRADRAYDTAAYDAHVARAVLEAVADDIRAEALADLAAAHPVPALTRAMNHARRAEDHWAADTVASLVDALTRCTRPHPTPDRPHPPHPRRGRHRQGGTGRLHHNHTTRDIKQRGECPACDDYHAQREQR